MQIQKMFKDDINRKINGVVKVDKSASDVLEQELDEYVITKELKKHFISFFNAFADAYNMPTSDIGVWISGFFGSGKSHLLKMLSYLLANQNVNGKKTVERFRSKFEDDPAIFTDNKGRYGVRRVHAELINRGFTVNHKRVQRIMHKMNLLGKRPKEKYHSYKGDVGRVADNIVNRDFSATAPLEKWTTDVSQLSFPWGKCYISPILDMYTNEIIAYDLSQSPNLEQISRMLNSAFERFPHLDGLIMHSDQGWQYQHAMYREELKKHGMIQSMSRKGNCYDNCIMETFFGRLKNEMFYGFEKQYDSFASFSAAIAEYIDYYNNERIQQKSK